MFGKREGTLNIETSISQWGMTDDVLTSLNSDFLLFSEYLWASLTVRGFLIPAGSSLSGAGLLCFLLANLRKLDNVRLLKVTELLEDW